MVWFWWFEPNHVGSVLIHEEAVIQFNGNLFNTNNTNRSEGCPIFWWWDNKDTENNNSCIWSFLFCIPRKSVTIILQWTYPEANTITTSNYSILQFGWVFSYTTHILPNYSITAIQLLRSEGTPNNFKIGKFLFTLSV